MMASDSMPDSKTRYWRFGSWSPYTSPDGNILLWGFQSVNGGFGCSLGQSMDRSDAIYHFDTYSRFAGFVFQAIAKDLANHFGVPLDAPIPDVVSVAFRAPKVSQELIPVSEQMPDVTVISVNADILREAYQLISRATAQLKACPEPDRYGTVSLAALEEGLDKLWCVARVEVREPDPKTSRSDEPRAKFFAFRRDVTGAISVVPSYTYTSEFDRMVGMGYTESEAMADLLAKEGGK